MNIKTLLFLLSFFVVGCGQKTTPLEAVQIPNTVPIAVTTQVITPSAIKVLPVVTTETTIDTLRLSAVGDLMVHLPQIQKAYDSKTKKFIFNESFKYMTPFLTTPNLLVGNLETTLAGYNGGRIKSGEDYYLGYSGYPCFNAPDAFGSALKDAGFDLVSTANNHSLDSKASGALRTLDQLDLLGIKHVGTYRSTKEADTIQVIELKGIKFAVISYTYDLNGFTVPSSQPYLVNTLLGYDVQRMNKLYADVLKAENLGVDLVVVMMHFGNEYKEIESDSKQKQVVSKLFENGADIVFGGHPHVLEPITIQKMKNSKGLLETKIGIYSLGNFISSQRNVEKSGGNTDLGVLMGVDVERTTTKVTTNGNISTSKSAVTLKGIELIPTYTHWETNAIMTLPLEQAYNHIMKIPMSASSTTQNLSKLIFKDWDQQRLKFGHTYSLPLLLKYVSDFETIQTENGVYIPLEPLK